MALITESVFAECCESSLTGKKQMQTKTENTEKLIDGLISGKSITGLVLGLLLIFALLFIDWRCLFQMKKFKLKFNIWK